jgi:hypothetical protein
MRIRTGLLLCLLLALGVAGCGGGGGGGGVATANGGSSARPSSSAGGAGLSDHEKDLRFAQCMRDNGVPKYPDPDANGGGGVDLNQLGVDKAKVDAAQEKCKQYAPNGGVPRTPDAQQVERMRQYARCMRENGVPKFPDPDANGGLALDANKLGMDPLGPKMKAAERACQKYMGSGGTTQQGGN